MAKPHRIYVAYAIYFFCGLNQFKHSSKGYLVDLTHLKPKDKLIIDGLEYSVLKFSNALKISRKNKFVLIEDIKDEIEDIIEYVPNISFDGAIANIESYIKMEDNTLIFLRLSGQDQMVKSITSVIMQGRIMQGNKKVVSDELGTFKVLKNGNKRLIEPLEDGVINSILFNNPTLKEEGYNVIVGRDEEEILSAFSDWLRDCQPLPASLHNELIFKKMVDEGLCVKLKSHNILAYEIKYEKLLKDLDENETKMEEIILSVYKSQGLISIDTKPKKQKAPLPKSKYLRENQVKKIFDVLDKMPKTMETDGMKYRPIGLKLFGGNFRIYVTEADIGCETDKYESMHTQCYGYVENLANPDCSEWGYINIPYYLEQTFNIPMLIGNKVNHIIGGFEQDIYFEDRFIDYDGNIYTKEQIESIE